MQKIGIIILYKAPNYMKSKLTILLLLTINLTVCGQHNFGLKINGGLSRISNSLNPSNSTGTVQFAPSGHAGFFYNLNLNNKSVIGAELLFMQIEGKEKLKMDLTDINGNNIGNSTSDLYKHISYLSLPICYGYKFNKLTINVGFQTSLVLTSSAREKGQATRNGAITTWDNKYKELNIDRYDFGPRAGVTYRLTKKFTIEGMYYFGANNILDNDVPNWTWRVQQATVGLRYTFLTTTKTGKD